MMLAIFQLGGCQTSAEQTHLCCVSSCGLAHLGDLLIVLRGARGLPVEHGEGVKLAVRFGLAHLGDLLNVLCGARGLVVELREGVKPAPIKLIYIYPTSFKLI